MFEEEREEERGKEMVEMIDGEEGRKLKRGFILLALPDPV